MSDEENKSKDEAEKKEAPQESTAPQAVSEPAGEKKKKKISRMSLQEVERAIDQTGKRMGGLLSAYGRALIAQKAILTRLKK